MSDENTLFKITTDDLKEVIKKMNTEGREGWKTVSGEIHSHLSYFHLPEAAELSSITVHKRIDEALSSPLIPGVNYLITRQKGVTILFTPEGIEPFDAIVRYHLFPIPITLANDGRFLDLIRKMLSSGLECQWEVMEIAIGEAMEEWHDGLS